jgi:hypothetical protein
MDKIRGQISQPVLIAAIGSFVLGLIIGLVVLGWNVWPLEWTDAAVPNWAPDLQQDYLALTIQSYATTQDAAEAQRRWAEFGEAGPAVLAQVKQAPPRNITPENVALFENLVKPAAAVPGGETTTTDGPFSGALFGVLVGMCILTLLIGGLLAYLFVFRNRQPALAMNRASTAPVAGSTEAPAAYAEGQEPPIAQYLTTFNLGNDLYDDSFSIDSPSGEFLGECGVGISETIGVGDPKKVTAFEVWLFDKNDIQTVTKVLMSAHAFNDPSISQRLASKGEPVLAEPGKRIVLETASLQLEARVVNMGYGQGALPANSYFDQMTLELAIWPKS